MADIATVLGLISSIIQICEALQCAYRRTMNGSQLSQKLDKVWHYANWVQKMLDGKLQNARLGEEASGIAISLQSVKQTLQTIQPANSTWSRVSFPFYGLLHSHSLNKELDVAVAELNSLVNRITLIFASLAKRPSDAMFADEAPITKIGLDRASEVLQFITGSAIPHRLCLVGIVGQGGLGKGTLLAHILEELQQSRCAFNHVAHVEFVNESPDSMGIRETQSSLLWQLGGQATDFQSVLAGKGKLKERLEALQTSGASVCIAIDNVWRAQDLEDLLPARFATLLPSLHICIIITSRATSTVNMLSSHCGGNPQVLTFKPPLLAELASREFLMAYANRRVYDPVKPHELPLVNRIVPFCGGLPLALKLVGALFAQKRDVQYWNEWIREMEPERPGVPIQNINHILDLSYKALQTNSQEALLDIGACLCRWSWDAVEIIVGSVSMESLKDFSLIDPVVNSATSERAVKMHDLIRKLAATKRGSTISVIWNPTTWSTSLLSSPRTHEAVKFLFLDVERAEEFQMLDAGQESILRIDGSCFAQMSKLKVLKILGPFICDSLLLPLSLQFLKLERNGWFTHANIPSQLQHLELKGCTCLRELPAALYECRDLRYLCIVGSPELQGFWLYSNWTKLSRLRLEGCASITYLPVDLVELKWLTLGECERIQELPVCYHNMAPQQVSITGCPNCPWPPSSSSTMLIHPRIRKTDAVSSSTAPQPLAAQGSDSKVSFNGLHELQGLSEEELRVLENVTIHKCKEAKALWLVVGKMLSMKKLRLKDCWCLELGEVPHEEMQGLTKFKVEFATQLRALPRSLCSLKSLGVLSLNGCLALQALPEDMGDLTALKTLKLQGCQSLRRLPNSICNLKCLTELDMTRCSKLERLPVQMGEMTRLRWLRLGECTSLETLPATSCDLKLLHELNMAGCSNLVDLPQDLGNLDSLKKLTLSNCRRLVELPHSLCRLAHLLSVFNIEGSQQLLQSLPQELQQVSCLRR
ncbi:hypothetical protein GOP47_0003221 [Adiantum capillus-veneris]|uniref:NB-ARC domain-containing protein n=1 Tax=Adiantum capillus-veneris TaxID=13818 RepID=A0A9D4VDB6_ADICA|nr:hypothetical protein GOP47_0003221 [Adiantum capillus-veneris]